MGTQDLTTSAEVDSYLAQQNALDLLRFITCGSVDDGKSTLIGRMLYEAQLVFEDQVATLLKDSKKLGTQGGDIDFALLVDGLAAEREQGGGGGGYDRWWCEGVVGLARGQVVEAARHEGVRGVVGVHGVRPVDVVGAEHWVVGT